MIMPPEIRIPDLVIHENLDALDIPVNFARNPSFLEFSTPEILGGMLRQLVRGLNSVPYYREHPLWQKVDPSNILSIDDILNLPITSKDFVPGTGSPTTHGIHGFRYRLLQNPQLLVPNNLSQLIARQEDANPDYEEILSWYNGQKVLNFSSGGSEGIATIATLSYLSVEMEAYALVRALEQNGMKTGQSIACFYNDKHKGGLQLRRAAAIMNMPFHSKIDIFKALENNTRYSSSFNHFAHCLIREQLDQAEEFGPIVREGIREYILTNNIQVIESVQPPSLYAQKNTKGLALAFGTLYDEDPSAFNNVEHVFLTGFPVPQDLSERLGKRGIVVSTTWGSSEAMALATSGPKYNGNVNNLFQTPFPTLGEVVRYRERGLSHPTLERVSNGEEGLLLITSLIGAGSTYINYRIGDEATKTDKGYLNIHRSNVLDIAGSCASDALGIK